jgi:hypothetical protein
MTDKELKRLLRAARRAQKDTPGPWTEAWSKQNVYCFIRDQNDRHVTKLFKDPPIIKYLTTFHPRTVLELLESLQKQQKYRGHGKNE